jgi:hypothetical protein
MHYVPTAILAIVLSIALSTGVLLAGDVLSEQFTHQPEPFVVISG